MLRCTSNNRRTRSGPLKRRLLKILSMDHRLKHVTVGGPGYPQAVLHAALLRNGDGRAQCLGELTRGLGKLVHESRHLERDVPIVRIALSSFGVAGNQISIRGSSALPDTGDLTATHGIWDSWNSVERRAGQFRRFPSMRDDVVALPAEQLGQGLLPL